MPKLTRTPPQKKPVTKSQDYLFVFVDEGSTFDTKTAVHVTQAKSLFEAMQRAGLISRLNGLGANIKPTESENELYVWCQESDVIVYRGNIVQK